MAKTNNSVSTDSFLGRKFQRVGKDVVVEVVIEDEKTKTVIIEFPEGKTMNISRSTLRDKRLWQPYEGDMPEAKEPEVETYIPGTPTEDSQVRDLKKEAKEEAARKRAEERAAKKAEKEAEKAAKKAEKKEVVILRPDTFIEDFTKLAEKHGCTIGYNPKVPNHYTFMYKNACVGRVYTGKNSTTLNMRAGVAELLPYEHTIVKNHMLAGVIKDKYTDKCLTIIEDIIVTGIEYALENDIKFKKKPKKNNEENGGN